MGGFFCYYCIRNKQNDLRRLKMKDNNTLHTFTSIRLNKDLQKFTTYPNKLVVFLKDSGEIAMLSTNPPYEYDGEISYQCYTICKEHHTIPEFLFKVSNNDENNNVYYIELWDQKTDNDVKFNEDLIMYFKRSPKLLSKLLRGE